MLARPKITDCHRVPERTGLTCQMSDTRHVCLDFSRVLPWMDIMGMDLTRVEVHEGEKLLAAIEVRHDTPTYDSTMTPLKDTGLTQPTIACYLLLMEDNPLVRIESGVLELPETWWQTLRAVIFDLQHHLVTETLFHTRTHPK